MHNQPQVLRNAVAAVIAGSLAGAAAGLWSVHSWPTTITASAQTPIVEAVVASPAPPAVRAPLPTASTPSKSPSSLPAAGLTSQGAPDAENPLQRARELARRPDVRGLLAVREGIAQRAASQNGQDSSQSRRQLDEIDRYLGEARALQLRLDAQELRRSAAIPAESR